jgi:Protein of unknown function (DUF4232)
MEGGMNRTHRRAALAFIVATMALLAGCGQPASVPSPGPDSHPSVIDAIRVISPHLAVGRLRALVPRDHYYGIIAGAVTTCGTEGVNLTPAEMASHPVEVTLSHVGRRISAVRLSRRSGFAFLVIGGAHVPLKYNRDTHEQSSGWSESFKIRTSDGFTSGAVLGGLPGIGEEVLQIAARPHVHPCYPAEPQRHDDDLVSIQQACKNLSPAVGTGSPATGEHALMITLTNTSPTTCELYGYPGIALSASNANPQWPQGRLVGQLRFTYLDGESLYLSNRPPGVVRLSAGAHAYVEVTKYRCDLGDDAAARTLRVIVPISGEVLTIPISSATLQGVGTLSYCDGGAHDPGNVVSVSPVSGSIRGLLP